MIKQIRNHRRKKPLKLFLRLLLIVFILMNIIAIFHGYKFTHFDTAVGERVNADKLNAFQKTKMLLFGTSLPRPKNTDLPAQPYETFTIQSYVKLEAWYIKAANPKGTVLLFHGYQGNKSNLIEASDEFLKMGYNTLVVDFMGSGGSEGNSTTIGAIEGTEVKDCFEFIKNKGEKNSILYGSSMGSVAVMKAIDQYKISPKAIIIGCPFGTMYKTVCRRFEIIGVPSFPLAGLLTFWGGIENGFWAFSHNPEEYAKSITCPALLLWGEKDNRVSRDEIDAIYTNLAGPKTLKTFADTGHGQYVDTEHNAWVNDVTAFLKSTN